MSATPLAPPTIAAMSSSPPASSLSSSSVRHYTNHHRVTPPKSTLAQAGVCGGGGGRANQALVSRQFQHHHQKKQQHQNGGKKAISSSSTSPGGQSNQKPVSRSKRKHQNKLKVRQQLQKKIQKQQQQRKQQELLLNGDVKQVHEQEQTIAQQQQEETEGWPMTVRDGGLTTPDAAAQLTQINLPENQHDDDDNDDEDKMMIGETKTHLHYHHQLQLGGVVVDDERMDTGENASTSRILDHLEEEIVAVPTVRKTDAELFAELQDALTLEPKFQPSLHLPQTSKDGEITVGARDGAAHVLRCLKVWYELPTDMLLAAVNLVDRFLAKMKVRPKHLACISVGSLYLSALTAPTPKQMNTEDLVLISQCRCTAGDLERMAGIIANKLGVQPGTSPVTPLTFIRIFYQLFRNAAFNLGLEEFYEKSISLAELEQRLEVLVCDAVCGNIRAAELALVLICTQMDKHASSVAGNGQISGLVDYAIELQRLARIADTSFFASHATVVAILARYNNQYKMPYKQRLVWKLSSRTMRVLRPSYKMTSHLPTIDEHNQANFDSLSRFRTGSLSSEDDEDWPTSPVVPIYVKEDEEEEEIEALC